ncbi:unnamed protein product [Prunus armeniaca]
MATPVPKGGNSPLYPGGDMGMADIPCWGNLSGHRHDLPLQSYRAYSTKRSRAQVYTKSIIFVKVPSISKYEWHSFSITSSSGVDDNTISIMIKSEGSWTSSLSHMIQTRQESDGDQKKYIPIAVEGPYGPVSMDFLLEI